MDSGLVQSLIRWTQKITGSSFPQTLSSTDYVNAFRFLLLEIDPLTFQQLQDESTKISDIISQINSYYTLNLNTTLSPNSIPNKPQSLTSSKVSQIFQLIFDIAFKVDHSKYVMQILNLKQSDQQILMSFVDTLMKEQQTYTPDQTNKDQIKRLLEELERKQNQNKVIKQKNDDLEQSVFDLKQRIIVLKDENDKLTDELSRFQSDKTQLLIQLGLHQYDYSYQQIVKQYKQQMKNYQSRLDQLENFIDSKNSQIQQSSSEIEMLKQSMGSKKELEQQKNYKDQEYAKILDKNNEQLQILHKDIQSLKQHIHTKTEKVNQLMNQKSQQQKQILQCQLKINQSQRFTAKYDKMKKIYKKFITQIKPHIN